MSDNQAARRPRGLFQHPVKAFGWKVAVRLANKAFYAAKAGYFERSGTYFHLGNRVASKSDAVTACELGNAEACAMAKRL